MAEVELGLERGVRRWVCWQRWALGVPQKPLSGGV